MPGQFCILAMFSPARWSMTVQPCLFWKSSKVECVPLILITLILISCETFISSWVIPTLPPKSQRFRWRQLVETCSFSSKTTNKRSLTPFFVQPCSPGVQSLCALPWKQFIVWNFKVGCYFSSDVPLSLASECRLVIRRALRDTRSSSIASLGKASWRGGGCIFLNFTHKFLHDLYHIYSH